MKRNVLSFEQKNQLKNYILRNMIKKLHALLSQHSHFHYLCYLLLHTIFDMEVRCDGIELQ